MHGTQKIAAHNYYADTLNMKIINFIIAIPTFKREKLLRRALASINKQNYAHLNVIVVDDSGDKPQKPFFDDELGDKLHYFYHDKNIGVNQVRNTLVKKAKELDPSAYIVFIDDDDFLVDNALSAAADAIREHSEFMWFTMDCILPEGKPISLLKHYGELSYIDDYMFGNRMQGDMMHIVHLKAITNFQFSDQFKNGEIWYFFCHLSMNHNLYAIQAVGKVSEYLEGGITKSGFNRDKIISVLKYKLAVLEPMVGFRKIRHQYISLAKHLLKDKRKQEAKPLLEKVFSRSPGYLRQYKHWISYFLN